MGFTVKELVGIPDNEIRTMLKIPCPVATPDLYLIQPLKALRSAYSITESAVCRKCPHSGKCPLSMRSH